MHTNFSTTAARESGAPHCDASPGRRGLGTHADVAGALARLDSGADPHAQVAVEVGTPASVLLHHGWVDRTSTIVVDLGAQGIDLVDVDVSFLPATIARLTMLQPRPRIEGHAGPVDRSALDALVGPTPSDRPRSAADVARAAGRWPDVAQSLLTGAWRLCVVDVADSRTGSTQTEQLSWLDTPAGLLRVDGYPHAPVLTGTSAESIWESLVATLPAHRRA